MHDDRAWDGDRRRRDVWTTRINITLSRCLLCLTAYPWRRRSGRFLCRRSRSPRSTRCPARTWTWHSLQTHTRVVSNEHTVLGASSWVENKTRWRVRTRHDIVIIVDHASRRESTRPRRVPAVHTRLRTTHPATWSGPGTAGSSADSTRTTSAPGSGTRTVFPALASTRSAAAVRSSAVSRPPVRSTAGLRPTGEQIKKQMRLIPCYKEPRLTCARVIGTVTFCRENPIENDEKKKIK